MVSEPSASELPRDLATSILHHCMVFDNWNERRYRFNQHVFLEIRLLAHCEEPILCVNNGRCIQCYSAKNNYAFYHGGCFIFWLAGFCLYYHKVHVLFLTHCIQQDGNSSSSIVGQPHLCRFRPGMVNAPHFADLVYNFRVILTNAVVYSIVIRLNQMQFPR